MSKILHLSSICIIILYLVSCAYIPPLENQHKDLLLDVASWLNDNALALESIAIPGNSLQNDRTHPIVEIPAKSNTFSIIGILQKEKPAYVLAINGIYWDGVIQQTWFKLRYQPLHTFTAPYDSYAPAVLYGYQPSPFDVGKVTPVTQKFTSEAPLITSYRVNTTRIFPGWNVYLTLRWQLPDYDFGDGLNIIVALYTCNSQTAVYTLTDQFNPIYETFFDTTSIRTYHSLSIPSNLALGIYDLRLYLERQNGELISVEGAKDISQNYIKLTQIEYPPLVQSEVLTPDQATSFQFLENNQPVAILNGYDMSSPATTDSTLHIGLVWHALTKPTGDYKVFVHLRDSANNIVVQMDNKPANWTYPTLLWEPGQYIYDQHSIELSDNVRRGNYYVYTGLYDAQTLQRLPIIDTLGHRLIDDEISLSEIKIW
jgi:hypothetical protein